MAQLQSEECGADVEKYKRLTFEGNMQNICVRCFRSSIGFEGETVLDPLFPGFGVFIFFGGLWCSVLPGNIMRVKRY